MNLNCTKAPLCKGSSAVGGEGLFHDDFHLQSLRQPVAATSLYTREAFYSECKRIA